MRTLAKRLHEKTAIENSELMAHLGNVLECIEKEGCLIFKADCGRLKKF